MRNPFSTLNLRFVIFTALVGMVAVGVLNTPASAGPGNVGEGLFSVDGVSMEQPAQGEKTIEQVQKNIQVLNGLPQSQLIPMMNFISSSLGVRCTYCHVNNEGKWDFAADVKPEKGTAREMIRMLQSVNKTVFRGSTEVSCWTCHRGRTHPVSVPPLPLPEAPRPPREARATPAASPGASPAPAAKEMVPTVEQILAKYQEAIGGSPVVQKLKTASMKGTWLTGNNVSLGYELYQSGPNKLYTVLNTPRQGTIERGFDGTVAWEQSARGLRDISGEELVFLRRYPDPFGDVKLKEQFTSLTAAGKDKIEGRDVYVVRGTTTSNKRERLYFDAQTGLLLRRINFTPTLVGVIPEQVDFDDYREVDGMKLPFKIRVSSVDPNLSSTRQFTEIKLNVPVDESKFKKPAPKPATSPSP